MPTQTQVNKILSDAIKQNCPDYKMPKKHKSKWVKYLKSGEFEQCRGQLCQHSLLTNEDSYCCLGVLGYAIDKSLFNIENGLDWEFDGATDLLPHDFCADELGFDFNYIQDTFASLNDKHKATFPQIAIAVEKYLWNFAKIVNIMSPRHLGLFLKMKFTHFPNARLLLESPKYLK